MFCDGCRSLLASSRKLSLQAHPELIAAIEEGYKESLAWWNQARQEKIRLLQDLSQIDVSRSDEEMKKILKQKRTLVDSLRRNHISDIPLEDLVYGNHHL
jgi:ABC-type nitrate/sulfonate/bicarbonate transport system substrate-binding protein